MNRNSTGPKKGTVFERIFETYICIDIFHFLCTFNSKFVCLFVCLFDWLVFVCLFACLACCV